MHKPKLTVSPDWIEASYLARMQDLLEKVKQDGYTNCGPRSSPSVMLSVSSVQDDRASTGLFGLS